MLEHQTRADRFMAFRTLQYAVLYWDRLRKAWSKLPTPRPPFQFAPVVPIVMHTGSQPWNTARRMVDLIRGPEMLLALQPDWSPIFWELSAQDPQRLLDSEEAFLQVLAVIRLEEAERSELETVFRAAIGRLEKLHGKDQIRWNDLLQVVMTWVSWRRPKNERKDWWKMAETMQTNAVRQLDLQAMRGTIGHEIFDEGREEGRKEELEKGLERERETVRQLICELGTDRFGAPPPEIMEFLAGIGDLSRLRLLCKRVNQAASWADLLGHS